MGVKPSRIRFLLKRMHRIHYLRYGTTYGSGQRQNPVLPQAERILIDLFAYRETLVRSVIQFAANKT